METCILSMRTRTVCYLILLFFLNVGHYKLSSGRQRLNLNPEDQVTVVRP